MIVCITAVAMAMAETLIDHISEIRTQGLPFAAPRDLLRTTEASLVREVLQMLQGLAGTWILWDEFNERFILRKGTHVSHLSQSSLSQLLQPYLQAATSLRKVEQFSRNVAKVAANSCIRNQERGCPTLEAFGNTITQQLEWLRNAALEMEIQTVMAQNGPTMSLLSLSVSMAWVCAGADFLAHIVTAIAPQLERHSKNDPDAALVAENILSFLFEEMNQFCLIEDGEEDAYRTLLLLFVGSLQPYVESLDIWLHEGNLYDPFGQLFFYSNGSVRLEDPNFWKSGYFLRQHSSIDVSRALLKTNSIEGESSSPGTHHSASEDKVQKGSTVSSEQSCNAKRSDNLTSSLCSEDHLDLKCPMFLQPLAKSIVSAGKSLQLLRFVKQEHFDTENSSTPLFPTAALFPFLKLEKKLAETEAREGFQFSRMQADNCYVLMPDAAANDTLPPQGQVHSLFEQFCLSSQNLLVEMSTEFKPGNVSDVMIPASGGVSGFQRDQRNCSSTREVAGLLNCSPHMFSHSTDSNSVMGGENSHDAKAIKTSDSQHLNFWNLELMKLRWNSAKHRKKMKPVDAFALNNKKFEDVLQKELNLEANSKLSPLEDLKLREAIFRQTSEVSDLPNEEKVIVKSILDDGDSECYRATTDYSQGDGCGRLVASLARSDLMVVQKLLPYPTWLPIFKEGFRISDLLQPQAKDNLVKQTYNWLQEFNGKLSLSPAVMVQECLLSFIQKQVISVGRQLLEKLMGEWRLMEQLALLRAVYLLGSGDPLQQFTTVLFNKLDRGEPWDDFYELNTLLQESVRCSTDASLQTALDSLFLKVSQLSATGEAAGSVPLHALGRNLTFDIDTLDSLQFSYKVAWPLELIIDDNAMRRYNQLMLFLLKVKRAKHALDKACRWTWKNGGGDTANHKQQLLLQQKLMHFVNTLHQYVMDRVLYRAWVELCEVMASASSLDEVIACHDTYLTSIQRQCFLAPDKLWTLISSRVKLVLGLALDYYSIQRTLCGVGGSALGMAAKCQIEVGKVERQFDECMVFLLRVLSFKLNIGHFPHLTDLVTRINYNYYYMSENGHLLTPVPETLQQLKANRS